MKRGVLILVFTVTTLISCSNKDGEDCSLFDPVFPSLYLKIVDSNGTNLLENETFKSEDISVKGNFSNASFVFVSENEDNINLNNTLFLAIPNQLESKYSIQLNDSEIIEIDFKVEKVEIACNISYNKPVEALFREENLELKEFDSLQYYLVVEL